MKNNEIVETLSNKAHLMEFDIYFYFILAFWFLLPCTEHVFCCIHPTMCSAALVLLLPWKYTLNYIVVLEPTFSMSPVGINMRISQ